MKCPSCQTKNPDSSRFCAECGTQLGTLKKKDPAATRTLHMPLMELRRGTTFAGRYEVIEELGRGGMGRVYKVEDKKIKEEVALKLLKPEIATDQEIIERFSNELRTARKIAHRNVCRMYHLGEFNDTYYITMELVAGEDLKRTIQRIGQMPTEKAIAVAKQICDGLTEAHRLSVVHRDLKPSNIMLDREGNAKIMDFGIARSLQTQGLTHTGTLIGTPEYMSPEQFEGKEIDHRADIYSLGIILYEMVTGKVPFKGQTPLSIGLKHKTEAPVPPRDFNAQIPEELSRVILKCLEKDAAKRYSSAAELSADLTKTEETTLAKKRIVAPSKRKEKVGAFLKARAKGIAAAGLACFALAGLYLFWRVFLSPETDYENFILFNSQVGEAQDIQKNIVEFSFLRTLAASTKLNIIVTDDYRIYKQKTELSEGKPKKPIVQIEVEAYPKATGFDVLLSLRARETELRAKKFECKGYFDFLSGTIGEMHSFIAQKSDGLIGPIEGNRTLPQISTDNLDALGCFLRGEEAWKKLDSEAAYYEFRTALENDPGFVLARIGFADVLLFRGEREEARKNLENALGKKEKLIDLDVLRLKALEARLDFRPTEERQYLGRLKESFPFSKEYHYEFAESYFNCGDGEEAIKHYIQALEIDPNYSLAHNHIAFCYSWIGDHSLAEKHFQKYVELDNTSNSFDSLATGYMFAGRYADAIQTLERGKTIDPNLDYLYTNLARNYISLGCLRRAEENIQEQLKLTKRESSRMTAQFWLAYIDFLRQDQEKALRELRIVENFYASEPHRARVDEAANLPFWLEGVIAADRKDVGRLREMIKAMESRIFKNNVNATNYFPIYKYYLHLKVLEGCLLKDAKEIIGNINEGFLIRNKMGYWSSLFNQSYFFDQYAQGLREFGRDEEALAYLEKAVAYNKNSASSYLNLAEIYLDNNRASEAREALQKASQTLSQADEDFLLSRKLKALEKSLSPAKPDASLE